MHMMNSRSLVREHGLTVRESAENDRRMESCPSFPDCEAPKCPLDALIDYRVARPGDARCKAFRITRLKLGSSLPTKGLTKREFRGVIDWYGSWENFVNAKGWKYGLSADHNTAVMPRGCLT
jgi:hypothetical protein